MSTPIPTGPIEERPEPALRSPLIPIDVLHAQDAAILLDALIAAGVSLGAYDRRIVEWLAGWERETGIIIASWIGRAYAAGRAAGGAS